MPSMLHGYGTYFARLMPPTVPSKEDTILISSTLCGLFLLLLGPPILQLSPVSLYQLEHPNDDVWVISALVKPQ